MTRRTALGAAMVLFGVAQAKAQSATQPSSPQPKQTVSSSASGSLLKAYQKEFAFLQAQKALLQKRIQEADQELRSRIKKAQTEVDRLQARVLGRTLAADREEDLLHNVERSASQMEISNERLDATLSQARATLGSAGLEVAEPPQVPIRAAPYLRDVLGQAIDLVTQHGRIRQEPGSFYLADGSQVTGRIVKIGQIASFGVAKRGSGALAPAGGNKLKLWHVDTSESAQALVDGSRPTSLSAFLYESLETPIEQKPDKSVVQFVQAGGVIAWVIVGLGIVALVMVVLRTIILLRSSSRAHSIVEQVAPMVEQRRRDEALEVCRPDRGAIARVLAAAIRNLDRDREHLEDIVSEAVLHETPFIERFSSAITVCAAVAPLLGLLGTVTGMISTFEIITEHGTGDPKLLSGGISEALVTTELGLIVAIPTLLLGNLLSSRGEALLARMERAALRIMNLANSASAPRNRTSQESATDISGTASIKPLQTQRSLS